MKLVHDNFLFLFAFIIVSKFDYVFRLKITLKFVYSRLAVNYYRFVLQIPMQLLSI